MKNNKSARPDNSPTQVAIPASSTSQAINWVGVLSLLLTLSALKYIGGVPSYWLALLTLLAYAVPIMVLEVIYLRTPWRKSTGLDFSLDRPVDWPRVGVKLLGLYATVAIIAGIYWCFPEYKGGFYTRYWQYLEFVAGPVLVGNVIYFALVDRRMVAPKDGFWQMGMAVLGRFDAVDKPLLAQHGLAWLVKLFFLPLMFIYTANFLQSFVEFDFSQWLDFRSDNQSYSYVISLFYGIDVVVVTVGYFCTLRIFDSHCRSTEPTAAGWFWAILCYEPIWSFVYGAYLSYNKSGYEWWQWIGSNPTLSGIWGAAIGMLTLIYVWASIGFGLRFSNLTNRGILTNGAYRYCKHPAYVSKNLSWWLISIPFVVHPGGTWSGALQSSLMLLGLNGIYYLRARTEERHLSSDETYVQYALAMNRYSIFAGLAKYLPFLQYRPGPKLVDIK